MSNFSKRNIFLVCSILPTLAFIGCDKESKKEAAQVAPKAPESNENLDTSLAPFQQADKGKFGVIITSTQKDARFKCSVVPEQQRSLPVSNWSDCSSPWVIDVQPGQSYVLRAKATLSSGSEDSTPAEYVATIPAPAAPVVPQNGGALNLKPKPKVTIKTKILDKDNIPAEVKDENIEINFGFEAEGVDPSQVIYECKTQQHNNYQNCPDKTQYKFANLKHGGEYRLKVRAVIAGDKVQSDTIEDEVSFKVNLSGGFVLANENDIAGKTLTNDFDVMLPRANRNLRCILSKDNQTNGREEQCAEKYKIKVRDLGPGSYRLVVKGQQNDEVAVAFCIEQCSQGDVSQPDQGGGGQGPDGPNGPEGPSGPAPGHVGGGQPGGYPQGGAQTYQIGSFYGFTVTPGMHVVQYATTKNHAEMLNYFSVTNDPYAIGNYNCTGVVDRILTFLSPSKVPYTYCNSTPSREGFKIMTEGRLALNHLEVATDSNIVEKNPYAHERIMINVFDSDYEFMVNRGKFSSLCAENVNARGRVTKSPLVPVIDRNFWGTWTNGQILACWGQFAEGPGIPMLDQQSGWWIGAFYISSNDNLPAFECYKNNWSYDVGHPDHGAHYGPVSPQWCQEYRNPSLIEVVYMTKKPFQQDYLFMQDLQIKFSGLLRELRPRM